MNTTTHILSRQTARVDWATVADLDAKSRLVCEYLDRAPRKCREAWWSAARIARDLGEGFSLSTVRTILRKLELRGLISTVVDYAIKTRRRLVLLWRAEPSPAPEPTPTPEPAPTPEGAMRDDLRRVRRPSVPPAAPAAVAEAPAEATRAGDAEARKATPEEVRELIEAAAKVPGGTPEKARSLAKSCTLSVVKAAAAQAAAKGKGWGWVVRTAQAWRVEGVPDHARPDAPGGRSLEEIARSLFGPGGKYSVPTFDMTPYQHLRLRDDR